MDLVIWYGVSLPPFVSLVMVRNSPLETKSCYHDDSTMSCYRFFSPARSIVISVPFRLTMFYVILKPSRLNEGDVNDQSVRNHVPSTVVSNYPIDTEIPMIPRKDIARSGNGRAA